jgi:hypothetical protein
VAVGVVAVSPVQGRLVVRVVVLVAVGEQTSGLEPLIKVLREVMPQAQDLLVMLVVEVVALLLSVVTLPA